MNGPLPIGFPVVWLLTFVFQTSLKSLPWRACFGRIPNWLLKRSFQAAYGFLKGIFTVLESIGFAPPIGWSAARTATSFFGFMIVVNVKMTSCAVTGLPSLQF